MPPAESSQHLYVVLEGSIIAEAVRPVAESVARSTGGHMLAHELLIAMPEGPGLLAAWRQTDDPLFVADDVFTTPRPQLRVVDDPD